MFFLQHQVDWGTNIEYDRNRHHLEFIISRQTPPSNKAIHATILKATIEQIIARTRQKHFQSQFLFDLYRLGVGTYYANMQQLTWQIQITPTLWSKVKKQALADSSSKNYNEKFWFQGKGNDIPNFIIWFLGEKIISELDDKNIQSLLKLNETTVLNMLKA